MTFLHVLLISIAEMVIIVFGCGVLAAFFAVLDGVYKIASDDNQNPVVNLAAWVGVLLLVALGASPFIWLLL